MSRALRQGGFSLVELLVAAGMTAIVSLATVGFLLTQRTFQRSTELQAETRQGLQGAMDMLARDIRLAGVCLEKTGAFSAIAGTNAGLVDSITLRLGKLQPDLDCVEGLAPKVGDLTIPAVVSGGTSIVLGTVQDFAAGDRVYILGTAGSGEFAKVSSVDSGTRQLTFVAGVSRDYLKGTTVKALTERAYTVSAGGGMTRPSLMLSIDTAAAQPVAVGITALDIQYELKTGCPSCLVLNVPTSDAEWKLLRSISLSATARAARAPGAGQAIHEETANINVKPRNFTKQ